ncbi:hypothetical protein [Streptomyces sp. B93]|uniref:hypothetical protein n=1 Tax=Streptomyces sp. B93 TaxID=2824875 RepID=UPI001B372AB3|nr:hypothetical protein [Streptomyces sp. B93]MBQ1088952.1 hypothetical protein [Streptomyces sp. B93]
MRTHTVRLLLVLALCAAVAGCGGQRPADRVARDGEAAAERAARARAVAGAWDGSEAEKAWRDGFHPLGDLVQLPEDAFHSDGDKRAYVAGDLVLRGELPTVAPARGRVTWPDGETLGLPLTTARGAYDELARGGGDGPHLTVTGARLGATTLATSRGPATVPAWLFTLKGYDTPMKRVAVAPSALPEPPVAAVREFEHGGLWRLPRLVTVAPDGRSLVVAAGHGACDDGPGVDVLETGGSVVLSAHVVGGTGGECPAVMLEKDVTVRLERPPGERLVLDAVTGRPVPRGDGYDAVP